ncbi:MAG: DUF4974 domain-containing protein [Dysgonomonas sp.]|uniref:FecR family protein n=1 Tax=Dysgonomonas sp. TaxID=1891233 RepID=UPI0039E2B902
MLHNDNMTDFFRRYVDKELTQDELDELRKWITQSAENKKLFLTFLSLYKTNIQVAASRKIDVEFAWNKVSENLSKKIPLRKYFAWTAVAASVAILFILSLTLFEGTDEEKMIQKESLVELYPNREIKRAKLTLSDGNIIILQNNQNMTIKELDGHIIGYNRNDHLVYSKHHQVSDTDIVNKLDVPSGSEYSITLPDGTRVWLNSESTLEYPLVFGSTRDVKLQGEAYFEVVHNSASPFIVRAEGVQVRVLGTKFNFSAYKSKRVKVTLVEGKVAIESVGGTRILLPGNQAQVLDNGESVITRVNTDIYTSWVTGRFEFNNTPMEDIMTQLSLWYGVDIKFASPALKNITFTGAILKNQSLGYALDLIQKVSNLDFEKDGEVILVKNIKK